MDKLSRKLTLKYAFLQSTYWISECAIYNFAAVFLHYKKFDNTSIGIVLALSAILSILLQPLVANYADKSKRVSLRSIVIALMFIVLISAIILFLSPSSFLLVSVVFILINTIQFTLNPLFNSLAFEYMNQGIPMNYGLARGSASVVFAITSYFVGNAIDQYGAGILLPIFILSYLLLILSAYLFHIKYSSSSPANTINKSSLEDDATGKDEPLGLIPFFVKYKKYCFFLIGISMIFYSHNLLNIYLINIIEHVGGTNSDMGLALTIAAALELPTMAAFIYMVKKIPCHILLLASTFFFFIKSLIMWLAHNVIVVFISQSFQMLAFALFIPASVYYVNSVIGGKDKVKGQSMLGVAMWGIAGGLASITGGRILDTLGVTDMLLLGVIVSVIGLVVVLLGIEKTGKID